MPGSRASIMTSMPNRFPADGTLTRALDASIDAYRGDGAVPGLALAVTDRNGLVVSRVAGLADVSGGRPVTESTLFEVGSIGKAFTAVVILQLAREGRLDIDDPVFRYLPWFRVPRTGGAITLRHLLSHTGGISAGVDGTPEATFQVWRLRDLPPGSAPGRRFHYSNVGYKALGLVIAAIEGTSYPVVIRRRILEPVGMTRANPPSRTTSGIGWPSATAPSTTTVHGATAMRSHQRHGWRPTRRMGPWPRPGRISPRSSGGS